jgi:O-antigen ligase
LIPFVPFFLLAGLVGLQSPVLFDSYSKLISYILLLIVVPWLVNLALLRYRTYFVFHLVLFGSLVLLAGLVLRIVSPGFVIFLGDRFSGLLGNPNGLGIFAFMFLVLVSFIFKYHAYLFSKNEKLFVFALIFISLILSGSRGGMFAALLFVLGYFLFQRSVPLGFLVMSLTLISYQLILANLDDIATALGLETFLRIETLKSGSGRLVAQEFALDQIQKNYWFGKGFGYAEYIMNLYKEDFIGTEHQGNVHNSYLTVWLHTGLIGLVAFCYGWWVNFKRAAAGSPIVWALLFAMLLSTSVESWLSASLNPFTIQLVMILTLAGNYLFYPELETYSFTDQDQEES